VPETPNPEVAVVNTIITAGGAHLPPTSSAVISVVGSEENVTNKFIVTLTAIPRRPGQGEFIFTLTAQPRAVQLILAVDAAGPFARLCSGGLMDQ
jgi:hypothetical protein